MPKITFISHAGQTTTIDAAVGMSVMRAAVMNAVDGIDAECGGACACATCHVIVEPAWADKLPQPATMEEDTLELVTDQQPTSRLSCQIILTEAMDGLTVRTPAKQG